MDWTDLDTDDRAYLRDRILAMRAAVLAEDHAAYDRVLAHIKAEGGSALAWQIERELLVLVFARLMEHPDQGARGARDLLTDALDAVMPHG